MTQVFISYSRKDIEFVESLVADLTTEGLSVWYDLSGLDGGTQWGTEIQKAIQQSQNFLLVLSPNSLESKWVQREFLYAESINIKVIPLLYKPCVLPMWLLDLQMIDLQGENYSQNFERVLKAMGVQSQTERLRTREKNQTRARLEMEAKERADQEEKRKQLELEEKRRNQVKQEELKARLEKEAKERRAGKELERQQKAESKARQQLERQKRKAQQKVRDMELWNKWKPGVFRVGGLGILLILVVFIGIQLFSGGFGTTPQPTSTLHLSETRTPAPGPTKTLQPSVTPEPSNTPLPVATQESSFILSIKEYISQTPPTFEDDFSIPNLAWGQSFSSMVADGQLNYREYESFPTNGLFKADDFILQYDFLYEVPNSYGIRFHVSPQSGTISSYYEFVISSVGLLNLGNNGWRLIHHDSLAGEELLESEEIGFIKGFHTLKIFTRQNNFAAYLDDRLLVEMKDLKALGGSDNLIYSADWNLTFDNVKFWNLDGVDLDP